MRRHGRVAALSLTKVLTIIPARGGSKQVPRKNVGILAGKPLIVYTIEAAMGAWPCPLTETTRPSFAE